MSKVIFKKKILINIILFLITFLTCTMAGTQWAFKDFTEVLNWHHGITYAVLILTFLSVHEFGHYFAARYHKVDATLPYYIPFPVPIVLNFGTLGAVIKIKDRIPNKKILFDIGVAGPIAGFIVCTAFLIYGLQTLPPKDFILNIHPEYLYQGGQIPKHGLYFGDTIFFELMVLLFKNPEGFLPPMNEIYHYPFLNVGWFGLFVTTLNMLPMGQLDGGHITYSMFGRKHARVARAVWWVLLTIGSLALLGAFHQMLGFEYENSFMQILKQIFYPPLDFINTHVPVVFAGWPGWLFWALIAKFFIKLDHPPVTDETEIDQNRKAIGWAALIILLLSFSYNGVYFIE